MQTLIILKGTSSIGKSSSLRNLIKLLINNDFKKSNLTADFSDNDDCFVILEKDNKKIAIITYGDPGWQNIVYENLLKCHENKIDYIVAASRTKYQNESVYKILWDFVRDNNYYGIETTTIVKYTGWGKEIDVDRLNMICAENLLNIINKL